MTTRAGLLLLGLAALALSAGCVGSPAPAATPDPFAALEQQANQAFQQGLDQYSRGDYTNALQSFQRAKLLSPTPDPRIDQMIAQTQAALAPTATPAPPTATTAPSPTPLALTLSTAPPDNATATQVFGTVYLVIVPGRNVVPPPSVEFYREDQIGLYIQQLDQRLRLPFEFRIFNLDTKSLLVDAVNSGAVPTPATAVPSPTIAGTPTPIPAFVPGSRTGVVRFWDNFVWYHQGGEPIGHYRLELYSGATLTNVLDYAVGDVPVPVPVAATPTPLPGEAPAPITAPGQTGTPEETAVPGTEGTPAEAEANPQEPKPNQAAPAAAAPAGPASPPAPPTSTPLPTATPTPAPALVAQIGGIPASIDVFEGDGTVFIADASGVVWTVNGTSPNLRRPFTVGALPVDLAVDQTNENLYISAKSPSSVVVLRGTNGQRVGSIPLPANPGEVRLDTEMGLLFVALPERQALAVVDTHLGSVRSIITGLPQITGLALDADNHVLYVSQLTGQISTIDTHTGQLVSRTSVTGAGLFDVATANGLVYGVNAPGKQLITFNPQTGDVSLMPLDAEPDSLVAGDQSGTVYVLTAAPQTILRIDPAAGAVVGQVNLSGRPGQFGLSSTPGTYQGLRARMAIDQSNETVYITQPEAGTLSVVPMSLFPAYQAGVLPRRGVFAVAAPGGRR